MDQDSKLLSEAYKSIYSEVTTPLKTKREIRAEREKSLPKPPPLPPELKYKFTPKEWKNMHLSKVRYDAKKGDVLKAWDMIKQLTNNFTKIVSSSELSSQDAIFLSTLIPRKGRFLRAGGSSPERIFRNYLDALLSNNTKQVQNLTNHIKFSFISTNRYMDAIKTHLEKEKDNPFIGV